MTNFVRQNQNRICQHRRGKNRRRAAVTVEYALSLPIVLLFFFALIEFSRASMLKHTASNSAYEAARVGLVPGITATDIDTKAQEILAAAAVGTATVTIDPTAITDDTQTIKVTVTIPYNANSWVAGKYLPTANMEATSTLRREDF